MRPIKTRRSNHNFGPPVGKEGEIGDLPCEIIDSENGERYVWSVWEPSDSEREAIEAGCNVHLGVGWIGAFPPVSLGVTHLTDAGVGDGHWVFSQESKTPEEEK